VTVVPGALTGFTPSGQPFAGAMSIVGISARLGGRMVGSSPVVSENGRRAVSHAASITVSTHDITTKGMRFMPAPVF
jgi:hypothetical protein